MMSLLNQLTVIIGGSFCSRFVVEEGVVLLSAPMRTTQQGEHVHETINYTTDNRA
jgi:hypothetical protein